MTDPTYKNLPPAILKMAPKRENFKNQEEYEEAKAFFHHRVKHLPRPRSQGSHKE